MPPVKQLGLFHGNMYALKLTDIDTYNDMKSKLVPTKYQDYERLPIAWRLWHELGIRRATASVRASKDAQNTL